MVNIANMMKQAQSMQKKMLEAQEKLAEQEYQGQAGGGMVNLTLNGKGDLLKIKISKEIANPDEIEILEDLVVAAFNDARKKQTEDSESNFSGLMGGMNLPAGFKLPF
jgi:DNA-binding YbaB/EbfC family protein